MIAVYPDLFLSSVLHIPAVNRKPKIALVKIYFSVIDTVHYVSTVSFQCDSPHTQIY